MTTPNKAQHTQGQWHAIKGDVLNPNRPWGVVKYLSFEQCREIDGDDAVENSRTEVIAEICEGPTDEADARLIAAAPELLAQLKEARDFIDCLMANTPSEAIDLLTNHGEKVLDGIYPAIAKAEGRAE